MLLSYTGFGFNEITGCIKADKEAWARMIIIDSKVMLFQSHGLKYLLHG
jgi:hypothetical protein